MAGTVRGAVFGGVAGFTGGGLQAVCVLNRDLHGWYFFTERLWITKSKSQ